MPGLTIKRAFSNPQVHPFDTVEWATRHVELKGKDGGIIYSADVEFPTSWSDSAVTITASKYFKIPQGSTVREYSLKQLIKRVVKTIVQWGREDNYFATEEDAETFDKELKWLLLHQYFAFNSPVYFNFGLGHDRQQGAACFILDLDDSIDSMMQFQHDQAFIFKSGSGAGVNLSKIRGYGEPVKGGGIASGAVSFMRGFDAWAGVIRSGGVTRRAAAMYTLNIDHPDIKEFITIKADEELKAKALIAAGFDGGMEGPIYSKLLMQNANLSIMVTDEFMEAVKGGKEYTIKEVTTGKTRNENARAIMDLIAKAAWNCGDPGIQFFDTINEEFKCPQAGTIVGSNPCSEIFLPPNHACNLASIKLTTEVLNSKYFSQLVSFIVIAMDIIAGKSAYPTQALKDNANKYRPLGLGVTNLGGFLMSQGLSYGSENAVTVTNDILTMIRKYAWDTSKWIYENLGTNIPEFEYRNAQLTCAAPTGTIAFMLDCDTTGIEPDYALVKEKVLIGGGSIKHMSRSAVQALEKLCKESGVSFDTVLDFIQANGTVQGSILPEKYWSVFNCAACPNPNGEITVQQHLNMLQAVQKNVDAGVSKTINLPATATAEDISNIYMQAWEMGLKCISVYRQGSKGVQPLKTMEAQKILSSPPEVKRYHLPPERDAKISKFEIGGYEGYITFGLYPDGYPGEAFISMSKVGSTVNGFAISLGILISLALQHGVPIPTIVDKLKNIQFEPSGYTGNPEIRYATSLVDMIAKKMELLFIDSGGKIELPLIPAPQTTPVKKEDGPPCRTCGAMTVRTGNCHTCIICGGSSGCSG